jgi:hypothetical protein
MRKPKKSITITICFSLLLLAMLLIAGCKIGGFFRGRSEGIETYDFQKGSDGVAMQFIEGMPPQQLFVGTEFSTGIKLKNMGSYDIEDKAELKITVPDVSAFKFKEGNTKSFLLRGKSLYVKEGEEDLLIFPMKALCFPGFDGTTASVRTNYTKKIKATACYYYETAANADLCIDTRKYLRQEHEKPECQMGGLRLSGGQGGPVGVTTISPTIIPKSEKEMTVQLSISISKLKGLDHTIYNPDNPCDVKQKGQNEVAIEVEMGGKPLQCTPAQVKLKAKEAVSTVCKRSIDPNLGAFLSPVVVKMKYYVEQSMLKDIKVDPPPGQPINCAALK